MAATVRSQLNGNPTILIEKMPYLGGDTIFECRYADCNGFRYQREVMHETKDSPAPCLQKTSCMSANTAMTRSSSRWLPKKPSVVDWLIDDLKIPYGPAATQYPDHSASRQLGVEGRLSQLHQNDSLSSRITAAKILMETRATSLIYKGGRVDGIHAVNSDGDKITINAKRNHSGFRRFRC